MTKFIVYNANLEFSMDKIKKIIESKALNEMVLELALLKKVSFSFAESCTGGLLASKITDLSGSSAAFLGGVVAYANQAKIDLLEVDPATLENFGAVSVEVAIQMAIGALKKFKTDYAVSISGIAGPTGGTADKPEGLVVIGYATKKTNGAETFIFSGDRIMRKDKFSDMALLTLLKIMNLD